MAIEFTENNTTSNPFQLGSGTFISKEVADASNLSVRPNQYLKAPTDQIAKEFETPPPGMIREKGTAALVQGAAAVRAALKESTEAVNTKYTEAQGTLSAAELASKIGATEFLSGSKDIKALDPFISAGTSATERLAALSGLSGADQQAQAIAALKASPGFQFKLDQGTAAIERSASAKGLLSSGRLAMELTDYAQGVASQTLGQETDRLSGLVNVGQAAAGQKANIALSVEQQRAETAAQLAQQKASLDAQQAELLASTRQGFTAQLTTLQQQLSAQQDALAQARAQLATQQSQFQQSSAKSSKQGAIDSAGAQLLAKYNAAARSVANNNARGVQGIAAQVEKQRLADQLRQFGIIV